MKTCILLIIFAVACSACSRDQSRPRRLSDSEQKKEHERKLAQDVIVSNRLISAGFLSDQFRVYNGSERIDLHGDTLTDLSPLRELKDIKIGGLYILAEGVSDLTPIADLHITLLVCKPWLITNGIEETKNMECLKTIYARGTKVSPLSPEEFWKHYKPGDSGKPDK